MRLAKQERHLEVERRFMSFWNYLDKIPDGVPYKALHIDDLGKLLGHKRLRVTTQLTYFIKKRAIKITEEYIYHLRKK